MISIRLIVIIGLMFVSGCATTSSSKFNELNVGMTKSEVIKQLGPPLSTRATEGVEYLVYNLSEGLTLGGGPDGYAKIDQQRNDYFVRLKNGVVDSYGRVGDFDSTKIPETRHTLDVNINPPAN